MNIFARRAAASEGTFFSQTSKESIARLREKAGRSSPTVAEGSFTSDTLSSKDEINADVLPEILQHSLPKQQQSDQLPTPSLPSPSSLVSLASAKSSTPVSHRRTDMSGLNFLPALPRTSFGPRRWRVAEEDVKIMASTANEARLLEGTSTIDDAKAKALLEGYGTVLKAFIIATALVIGGATVATTIVVSKLQIHSIDDIRIKGSEHMQPRVEAIHHVFEPWRQWQILVEEVQQNRMNQTPWHECSLVQERRRDPDATKRDRSAVGARFAQTFGLKQIVNEVERK